MKTKPHDMQEEKQSQKVEGELVVFHKLAHLEGTNLEFSVKKGTEETLHYYLKFLNETCEETICKSDKKLLIEHIHKLINTLKNLEDNLRKTAIEPAKLPLTENELFLIRTKTIIEENLSKKAINGEFVSKQLKMSRMQLHRRLKKLTGLSTSKFITEIRLQHAYQLLQSQHYNVSEVVYQTGFSTIPYFSKVFKKRFNKPPSTLLKK